MSEAVVVAISILTLIVLILMRVPVAFSLLGAGALGLLLLDGFQLATSTLASEPYQGIARYAFIVIPMFILMGMFAMESGIATGAFELANRLVGRLPGGLGIATVLVCAVFAAVSGSSPATVATIGRITIPEMRRRGYTREFTAGIIGTAGTLGVLIPPSIVLVVFGIATGISIGNLLIAGILPGLLSVLVLSVYIVGRAVTSPAIVNDRSYVTAGASGAHVDAEIREVWSRTRLRASPPAQFDGEDDPDRAGESDRDVTWRSFASLGGVLVLFITVIGGIYSGLVTATESAALGALASLIILLIARWGRNSVGQSLVRAMRDSAATTCMIFAIIIGSSVFSVFLVRSGVTGAVSEAVLSLGAGPLVIVALVLLLLLPLGMFLDATSIILITMPVLWPALDTLDVDGVWFGILVVVMIEIGLITPPVGINGFVLVGIAEDISTEQAFRGLFPFVLVQLLIVGILFAFPPIVTYLPSIMQGS